MKTHEHYKKATEALEQYEIKLQEYHSVMRKITTASIELDSITAFVTKEKDEEASSKTALKELVKGDARVMSANHILQDLEASKAISVKNMDYLNMVYTLEKKAMDVLNQELKFT